MTKNLYIQIIDYIIVSYYTEYVYNNLYRVRNSPCGKKRSLSPSAHLSFHPNVWITNMRIVVAEENLPLVFNNQTSRGADYYPTQEVGDSTYQFVAWRFVCARSQIIKTVVDFYIHNLGWNCWSTYSTSTQVTYILRNIWLGLLVNKLVPPIIRPEVVDVTPTRLWWSW